MQKTHNPARKRKELHDLGESVNMQSKYVKKSSSEFII
jgi:hypothetical protein